MRHNIEVIRGDTFELMVGLARGWEDIDDTVVQGRLVFRDAQDDDLQNHLEMTALIEPGTDYRFPDLRGLLTFTADPATTQALPDWPLVCFCELTDNGGYVRRLFDGRVKVRD